MRQRTLTETAYRSVAGNAEDTRLQNSIAGANANVRVIEAAQVPTKARTGRMLILAAGLLVGILAALAVIIVSAAASPVMVTPRDVESRLRNPVLAAVPLMDDENQTLMPRWRPLPQRLTGDDAALVLRRLRETPTGSGVMVLAGPEDGVGVTSIALDLAIASAFRSGVPTLLIDAEPVASDGIALALHSAGAQLTKIASSPYVLQVEGSNLHVTTPMARAGSNISEARWRTFIDGLRPLYPVIIIDAPALHRSTVALLLAPLAEASVIVVEAEETRE